MNAVHLSLLRHGIFIGAMLAGITSVPMGKKELDAFVEATEKAVRENMATG